MKIVCDSCATKYSISDDKVRGKVFKIRCKKCSHIIVVRGTNDAAAAPATAATEGGGWHLVVDGEQVGPLPESEIRARLARGEINGETYIWKEGLADWLKLATVTEFSDISGSAQPAEMLSGASGGDLFTDNAPISARGDSAQVMVEEAMVASSAPAPAPARAGGGGLFSAIDASAAQGAVVSSARVGRAAMSASAGAGADHDDAFGAPAARGGGGDLFASHAAAAQPSPADDGRRGGGANHDGGRVENLTAQRHENSVLFSLANLQQLAMPAPASKSAVPSVVNGNGQSEGSGLIDIRAMAATTMGGPADSRGGGGGGFGDELPTFGSFSAAAPVLLPLPSQSGPPKWIYALIGGMVLLVIGIGIMAYKILTTKPVTVVEQVPVAVAPASPPVAALAPKAAAPAAPAAPAAAPIPDENLPPREGAGAEAAKAADAAKHEKGAGGKKSGKGGKGGKEKGASAEAGGKAAVAVAAPAPEPEKKAAKGSLDDLLENALSGKKSRPRPSASDDDAPVARKSAPAAEAAGPLSKSAVVSGMNSVKPKINDCYNQFKVPGMAMVSVVIAKNGKVSSATVSGKFAGTPTGSCVEKAVKSASFPPSEGLSTPYPFQLK
jgi:predicted Zn finger-like uncharacterized protein